jgi:hypothetical protein
MIDWQAVADKAAGLSTEGLEGTIQGILDALPHADALDRITGQDRGGEYRDEISVYRAEARRRKGEPCCPSCGRRK